ncbi:MAG: 7,8-didemethyl-8-hydroxy-5-deazariboflavin synthase, partial [Novosphingobium sp.]
MPTAALLAEACERRDGRGPSRMTYSRKVFIPLTRLCADVCHYCTFATTPANVPAPYMSLDEVLDVARAGADAGCKEALFTLGD